MRDFCWVIGLAGKAPELKLCMLNLWFQGVGGFGFFF